MYNIIHYELPDDFETFSYRYSVVLPKSEEQFHNQTIQSSIIMTKTSGNELNTENKLIYLLITRQYNLKNSSDCRSIVPFKSKLF